MYATMSPAEVAALRHMMGLSQAHMATMLGVNVRTVRSWESGRDMLSESSTRAMWELARRHDKLVRDYLDAGVVIGIERDMDADDSPPRGWYLAAAGRAMLTEPDLAVGWM